MDTTAKVRQFITSNFYVADAGTLTDQASLLEAGIIDSTGVLEVVGFLETEFGLAVEDEEIAPENLDSIARISLFVQRRLAVAALRQGTAVAAVS